MGGLYLTPLTTQNIKKALIGNSNTKQTDTKVSKKAGFRLLILNFCTKTIKTEVKMKYRKKNPSTVEAFRFRLEDMPSWFMDKVISDEIAIHNDCCYISTRKGIKRAEKGDYIIMDTNRDICPCKPDIFEMTYEKV